MRVFLNAQWQIELDTLATLDNLSLDHIQLLEYVIPPAAPATATAAPPKSPLCYGVSHVMVLAMLWC